MKQVLFFTSIMLGSLALCYESQDQHSATAQQAQNYYTGNIQNPSIPLPQFQHSYSQRYHYANDLSAAQKLAVIHNFMSYLGYAYDPIPYAQRVPVQCAKSATSSIPLDKSIIGAKIPTAEIPKIPNQSAYLADVENTVYIQQLCPEWDRHGAVIDARIKAIEQIKSGNSTIGVQRYTISQKAERFCLAYNIDSHLLSQCSGIALQQVLHQEFVAITDTTAALRYRSTTPKPFHKITHSIADFAHVGIIYNNKNEVKNALILADACWMLLDCIQAAGEGLVDGVSHIVDDAIHPVRTVQAIIETTAICGYYVGKIALEIGHFGYLTLATDSERINEKLDAWKHNFSCIYDAIKEKRSTLKTRDVIKETVSCGVQFYAAPKVLHGLGRLFKHAHKHVITFARNIPALKKTQSLTTPEGVVVRIANGAAECMKNNSPSDLAKPLQVSNMSEFFKNPFGQKLLKKSQKTSYRYQNPIYKLTEDIPGTGLKKNHYYYLDRLHGDHLEVFDHVFQCVGVYNLDGTFNQLKYNLARKNGRNIRNLMKGR